MRETVRVSATEESTTHLHERPVELLAQLLRFDTTNPPGNERGCIEWIRGLLEGLGCEVRILGRSPERPNLIARLRGAGAAPPFLMQGHVDVVAAAGTWRHGPFAGEQSMTATSGAAARST